MFCTNKRKANWYLKRKLAVKIQGDPPKIQLTFQPNGVGNQGQSLGLIIRKNECVVCGNTDPDLLNRHHIVPYCYRKYLPKQIKNKSNLDVVATCFACHEKYESEANKLKEAIAIEYDAPVNPPTKTGNIIKVAKALLLYRKEIPAERIAVMEKQVHDFLGKTEFSAEDLASIEQQDIKEAQSQLHGCRVAQQLVTEDKITQFYLLWRRHFMSVMKPKFMPDGWHENLPVSVQEN